MIYALDKIALGIANDVMLLYGVDVKFYNMEVDDKRESFHKELYIIGDGSGITYSLSHASASGVYVARQSCEEAQEKRTREIISWWKGKSPKPSIAWYFNKKWKELLL